MSVLRLRGPSDSDTLQRVILEGVEYSLRWRYVQSSARWALDIRSADGVELATGIRVVQEWPLLQANRAGRPSDTFPPGELFVLDPRTTGRVEPGLDELGADLVLLYVEADTLGAL